MLIVNITQHAASPEQIAAGVVDLQDNIKGLLTFDDIQSTSYMTECAQEILKIVVEEYPDADMVMAGGAPYFMSTLEKVFKKAKIKVVYAFSKRESVEVRNEDGTTTKSSVFKHLGFVDKKGKVALTEAERFAEAQEKAHEWFRKRIMNTEASRTWYFVLAEARFLLTYTRTVEEINELKQEIKKEGPRSMMHILRIRRERAVEEEM